MRQSNHHSATTGSKLTQRNGRIISATIPTTSFRDLPTETSSSHASCSRLSTLMVYSLVAGLILCHSTKFSDTSTTSNCKPEQVEAHQP
eukprot:398843-Rhodomonas_salina.3